MIDLERARTVAVAAAEAAGVVLAPGGRFGVQDKGESGDLVTDLDHRAESIILDRLRSAYPDHAVLAEESGMTAGGHEAPLWVVDPLDGTHNLTIGLPAYSVGIALCVAGVPVVGVIHDPITRQTWSAVRDQGTHGLADAPRTRRSRPIVSWIQGYAVSPHDVKALAIKHLLGLRSQRVLQLWAPQLTWIMLARGAIDGIVAYRTGFVDLPAGALIAAERGVALTALDGGPFPVSPNGTGEHSFIAARPEALDAFIGLVGDAERLELPVSE